MGRPSLTNLDRGGGFLIVAIRLLAVVSPSISKKITRIYVSRNDDIHLIENAPIIASY